MLSSQPTGASRATVIAMVLSSTPAVAAAADADETIVRTTQSTVLDDVVPSCTSWPRRVTLKLQPEGLVGKNKPTRAVPAGNRMLTLAPGVLVRRDDPSRGPSSLNNGGRQCPSVKRRRRDGRWSARRRSWVESFFHPARLQSSTEGTEIDLGVAC
eukprot:COSAG06_NODE_9088_length_1990_cov_1.596510_3_plen_156_part_00